MSGFENEDKEEVIDVLPNEIIYDGSIQDRGTNIINCRLLTPGGYSAGVLLLFYNKHSFCPRCDTSIKNRPILLMDNNEFAYPCLFCGVWVWWPVIERNIESKYQ